MSTKVVEIEMSVGGLGDNWMRLTALYSMAALRSDVVLTCVVPSTIRNLAENVFADRLNFTDRVSPNGYFFTNRGIRHLLSGLVGGKRYLAPYHRLTVRDWGRTGAKVTANCAAFNLLDRLDLVGLPPRETLEFYQGYVELMCLRIFRNVLYSRFVAQSGEDFSLIRERLRSVASRTVSNEFESAKGKLVVFPSGSGHQIMPVDFARTNMPDAFYCLHERDEYAGQFQGMSLLRFSSAEDILNLAFNASVSVTTDSFPSHLIQYLTERSIVLLAEQPASRIVSPHFDGIVIYSQAPCSPCPHLDRSQLCKAGLEICLTWQAPAKAELLQSKLENFRSK